MFDFFRNFRQVTLICRFRIVRRGYAQNKVLNFRVRYVQNNVLDFRVSYIRTINKVPKLRLGKVSLSIEAAVVLIYDPTRSK
jgi:hypothetical protein